MKCGRLYTDILSSIHSVISSEAFLCRSVKRNTDFSRRRKLSFTDYVYLTVQNLKSSLQVGLNVFIDAQKDGEIAYSKQAFSKGRQRIKPEAFQELYQEVVLNFYEKAEITSWEGYQLFGIDGTRLNLPCTEELAQLYGVQTSQGAPQVQALVSCVYDLLNGIIVDTRFARCQSSERDAAKDMITAFHLPQVENPLFIMDRGYPSAELIDAIVNAGHKFIMRCPTEFLRSMKLPEMDNTLAHKFAKLKYSMKIRVVKVQLSNGNIEYLATNIFDSQITLDDFKWAYQKRWGIETKYYDVKNKLEIENFTGYSSVAILQDFYATMFLANLAGVLEYDLHEEIATAHSSPENRYAYKMNIAMTISELKRNVVEMLSTSSRIKRERLYAEMASRLTKAVVPIRPNRSAERIKKHKSMRYPNNLKRN